ncbi:hypothetical protein QM285_21760, partial [Stutzerimonas stutzeri]|nr:hypothetical protein [Stutzerimonas stutzeri]
SLLAERTSAYLASQSFLMIAFASSMANSNPEWGDLFRLVVPAILSLLGLFLMPALDDVEVGLDAGHGVDRGEQAE